jgi:hypothetical protein
MSKRRILDICNFLWQGFVAGRKALSRLCQLPSNFPSDARIELVNYYSHAVILVNDIQV